MSEELIPHWPGRLVNLGDHQVFVRSVPTQGSQPVKSRPSEPPVKSQPVKSQPVKSQPVKSQHCACTGSKVPRATGPT